MMTFTSKFAHMVVGLQRHTLNIYFSYCQSTESGRPPHACPPLRPALAFASQLCDHPRHSRRLIRNAGRCARGLRSTVLSYPYMRSHSACDPYTMGWGSSSLSFRGRRSETVGCPMAALCLPSSPSGWCLAPRYSS